MWCGYIAQKKYKVYTIPETTVSRNFGLSINLYFFGYNGNLNGKVNSKSDFKENSFEN